MNVQVSSRFVTFKTPVSVNGNLQGWGLYVKPLQRISFLNLGYSFFDLAQTIFLSGASGQLFQARIAVIIGPFGDDPKNFTVSYNLQPYDVRADYTVNDMGPANIQYSSDADDGPVVEPGIGATVLVSQPIVVGSASNAYQIVGTITGATKRGHGMYGGPVHIGSSSGSGSSGSSGGGTRSGAPIVGKSTGGPGHPI